MRLLRQFGMTTIFGNPGSTELPMFREFPEDFRYVLGLQESVALGMADGFAQATRNAAFVNLHSSAGVGHALGNLFTAYRNQTPLVVTAGQQARSILPYAPFLYAEQATEFPKPFVKWSCEPARAEDVPAAIARAYYVAMQPPRGPTFVSVPIDDWDRLCVPVAPRVVSRTVRGDAALLAEVSCALGRATRPVIVAGAGVARDGAWDALVALAEWHNAPVWASPMSSRNAFPEDHALFAGFLPADRTEIRRSLLKHDLVLVLGAPAFTYHVEGTGPHIPEGATLFQIVDDPDVAAWAPTGTAIVADLRSAISELMESVVPASRSEPPRRPSPDPLSGAPLTDSYALQQIAALRPITSIIVEEAPSSRVPMQRYLPITRPDSFFTCASGGLGHGLPASVGVALARPDARVIAIIGDGSAMYAIQSLWSAVELGLAMTFVIINNRRYEALVRFGQRFAMDRTVGTDLSGIDFCGLARSQGCAAMRVEHAGELDGALAAAFEGDRPTLVEVMV
jgi:benzoylformate decarboxylase